MGSELVLWQAPEPTGLPAKAKEPDEIVPYAVALKAAEQEKVIRAMDEGMYELATEFVWKRSLSRLKQTLSSLGMQFVGEMLGRDDISESSAAEAVLTDWDAIRLAELLGVISTTGSLRLRHAFELLAHLSLTQEEELERAEAVGVIKNCVRYVLSESDIGVALDFSRFRERLTSETLSNADPQLQTLLGSAPFFVKTTLRVLLATVKAERGAKLEHSLANFNLLLPEVWERITEEDKWAVGTTYAEVANEGKTDVINALRRSLLRVSGFDYVPESLRSNTFKAAAQAVIEAHFGRDNFYLETEPVKTLSNLGTVIPRPALIECIRAYLCVYLGNRYGFSFAAAPLAQAELNKISSDRWEYYLGKVILSDDLILEKLMQSRPTARFSALIQNLKVSAENGMPALASKLIAAAREGRMTEINRLAENRWVQLRQPATQSSQK